MTLFATSISRQRARVTEAIYCYAALRLHAGEDAELVCLHRGDVSRQLSIALESVGGISVLELPPDCFFPVAVRRLWPLFADYGFDFENLQIVSAGVSRCHFLNNQFKGVFTDGGELVSVNLEHDLYSSIQKIPRPVLLDILMSPSNSNDQTVFYSLMNAAKRGKVLADTQCAFSITSSKSKISCLDPGVGDPAILSMCRAILTDIGYAWDQEDVLIPQSGIYDLTRRMESAVPGVGERRSLFYSFSRRLRNRIIKRLMDWRLK